jgi:hypothetical protein
MSTSTSSSSASYAFAYDALISNEHREIERVVHFYPENTPERIQCETSAFLCGLDAFMSTFTNDEEKEEEEEEEKEEEEEEEDDNSKAPPAFVGAKTRGKFYAALEVVSSSKSSIWCAVVVDSKTSRLLSRHFSLEDEHPPALQGNECLRFLRETMSREVKEKLLKSDIAYGKSEEETRKWKEELKRLIDRLGKKLKDEESSTSSAVGSAVTTTSVKEEEDIAYVLEERKNKNDTFLPVQTSASKSWDALRLVSKREAMRLRDEVEATLEGEEEESKRSATTTTTTMEKATRPGCGHDAWLWSRVNADRTKRLFFATEREDVKTLLQAKEQVTDLDA